MSTPLLSVCCQLTLHHLSKKIKKKLKISSVLSVGWDKNFSLSLLEEEVLFVWGLHVLEAKVVAPTHPAGG